MRLAKFLVVVAALAVLAVPAQAQFAKNFTWGPTLPLFKIPLDTLGSDPTFLDAGAGVKAMLNVAPTQDGRWRMVTFGLPIFVNYSNGLGLDAGLTIGTFNDLLSFGVASILLRADDGGGPSTGLLTGDGFTRQNTYLIVSASLNFGAGGQGSAAQQQALMSKAGGEPVHTRPPGYVGW